jgi:hypothetical protein
MLRAPGGTWGKHIKDVSTPKGLNVKSHWWNLGKTYQKCLNPEGVECE